MIIDFTIKNYRSFKESQTLSLLATKLGDENKGNVIFPEREDALAVLKSAGIYGANASGKTNVLKALKTLHDFILNSTDLRLGQSIPYYEPFKLEENSRRAPVELELEFIANDAVRYKYAMAYTEQDVLFEELVFFPRKQESRLFLREKDKPIKYGPYLKGRKKNIESELLSNTLFLSKAANSNQQQLKEIYLYFAKNFRFHTISGDSFYGRNLFPEIISQLRETGNINFKEKLVNFLTAADTGIRSVGVEKAAGIDDSRLSWAHLPRYRDMKEIIYEALSYNLVTYHESFAGEKEAGIIPFRLDEESNGTLKMIHLAGKIINVLEDGYIFVVDELDSSIHALMSEFIIELFHSPETNPNNAQIIFTTHDTTLLNPKQFRRDQIWFTAKNEFGSTDLFSLDEFDKNEVRKNTAFDKWYLNGRFGALPLINKKFFTIAKKKDRE